MDDNGTAAFWLDCNIDKAWDELSYSLEEIGQFIQEVYEYSLSGKTPSIRNWDELRQYIHLSDPYEQK